MIDPMACAEISKKEYKVSPEGDTEIKVSPEGDTAIKVLPEGDTEIKVSPEGDTEIKVSPEGDTAIKVLPEGDTEKRVSPEDDTAKRVSILLPTYNGERYLSVALDSVLSQTFTLWQLTVVDDGSLDKSLDIANQYAAKDARITVRSNRKNLGLYGSINDAASKIDSEFIVIFMQDDVLLPTHLQCLLDLADRLSKCQTYWSGSQMIDAQGLDLHASPDSGRVEEITPGVKAWWHILQAGCIWIISGALIRTDYLKKERFRADLSHAADWDWILRLARTEPCAYLENRLVQIRLHTEQASSRNFLVNRDLIQYKIVVNEHIGKHANDIGITDKFKIMFKMRTRILRRVLRHAIDFRWASAWWAFKLLVVK